MTGGTLPFPEHQEMVQAIRLQRLYEPIRELVLVRRPLADPPDNQTSVSAIASNPDSNFVSQSMISRVTSWPHSAIRIDAFLACYATHAAATHPEMWAGDVLVGDRAFGSFAHLALLRRRGLHGVFRLHQRRPVGAA